MIEAVMYYALGLLSAGIVALLIGPPLWRRAVRLNHRAIEQTLPMTRAEIDADKDQLRAAFAVSTRRLESTIERLENQSAVQRIDLGHRREIISRLTVEGAAFADDKAGVERQRDELRIALSNRDDQLARVEARAVDAERRLGEIDGKLVEAHAAIEAMVRERDAQRETIAAREAELAVLRQPAAAIPDGATIAAELSEVKSSLAQEREKLEAASAAAAGKPNPVSEELASARAELAKAEAQIEALSLSLVEAEAAGMSLFAAKDERAGMQTRLAALEAENDRLKTALDELRATRPESTDEEARLLRGKLIEIGSAVARLSARSEGLTLVPPALPAPPANGAPANGTPASAAPANGTTANGTLDMAEDGEDGVVLEGTVLPAAPISLAERIRALQKHASGGL